jgi:DNA-binding NarL/FixJ family response regulator
MPTVRVLVAHDNLLVRQALAALILAQHDMVLVGQASTAAEAIQLSHCLHPDVLIITLLLAAMDSVAKIWTMRQVHPCMRIIALDVAYHRQLEWLALSAGATAYALETIRIDQLLTLIRDAGPGSDRRRNGYHIGPYM